MEKQGADKEGMDEEQLALVPVAVEEESDEAVQAPIAKAKSGRGRPKAKGKAKSKDKAKKGARKGGGKKGKAPSVASLRKEAQKKAMKDALAQIKTELEMVPSHKIRYDVAEFEVGGLKFTANLPSLEAKNQGHDLKNAIVMRDREAFDDEERQRAVKGNKVKLGFGDL